MKRFAALALACLCAVTALQAQTLRARLEKLENVRKVEALQSKVFEEKYLCTFRQFIVPGEPAPGFFDQRVVVMHKGYDRPVVLITEGYGADYGLRETFTHELSRMLDANVVLVEHRFFGPSTPQPRQWVYLKGEYAMADLHAVREALGTVYKGKWVATGASKGGQTALMFTTFYPNDVDATVSYVAPLCRAVEDGRHEPFLARKAGTPQDRERILAFQKAVLERRDSIQPRFDAYCTEAGLRFTRPLEEILDYTVLEYPFAFWQFGTPVAEIPAPTVSDSLLLAHLVKVANPDYFVNLSPTQPFFVQAAKELGYYGYDTKPFGKLLKIKKAKGYLKDLFLPEFYRPVFRKTMYKTLLRFTQTAPNKLMFIYGEWDPWSAVAVPNPGRENVKYYVEPRGSHRAKIATLPRAQREEAEATLRTWLQ